MRIRLLYIVFGLLATLVGVAAGHFLAAFLDPSSSPVLAVGSAVIDLTPTPVKEWAISNFGTKDKPILIGSVMLGVLVFAGIAGLLARRRFVYGAVLLVVLVTVAATAAMSRPASEVLDLLPSILAAVAGVASLGLLDRQAHTGGTATAAERAESAGASSRERSHDAAGQVTHFPTSDRTARIRTWNAFAL